jgi:hypothetical protein
MNWLAASLICIGYILVISKKRLGFIVQIAGCTIYIIIMLQIDLSVVAINAVFWIINAVGFYKWRHEAPLS